jgi:hypothetical protein
MLRREPPPVFVGAGRSPVAIGPLRANPRARIAGSVLAA